MNIRLINKILFTCLLLLILVTSKAQISTNQGLEVLGNVPTDTRDTLTTLGDTSNVVWVYPGLLSYAVDQDQFWYHNGSYWSLFAQGGGLDNMYLSNDTLYSITTDSTYSVFLPYIDSLLLADSTTTLRSLISAAGSQYIDTLQLQGDTMLQISIFGDNQPLKELNLSALSGDNLGNHTMTQNLQTNGNWISGDGGNEGIAVDAAGVSTLTSSASVSFPLNIYRSSYTANPFGLKIESDNISVATGIRIDRSNLLWDILSVSGSPNSLDFRYNNVQKFRFFESGNMSIVGNFTTGKPVYFSGVIKGILSSVFGTGIYLYDPGTGGMSFRLDGSGGGNPHFEFRDKDGNYVAWIDRTGQLSVGSNATNPTVTFEAQGTDAIKLPVGTTAQRPTGANGLLRYNSDSTAFTGYYNAQWNRLVDHSFLYSSTARSAVNYWKKNGDLLNYGVNNAGRVGIGVNLTSIYKFGVTARSTDGFRYGTYSVFNLTPGSGYAEGTGMQSSVNYIPTASGSSGYAKGGMFSSVHSGSFPGLSLLGGEFAVNSASSSTLNSAIAGRFLTDVNNTSSTTNAIGGFFGLRANGTTSITNYTGLQVGVYAVRQNSTIGTLKGIEVFDHAGTSGTNSIVTQYGLYIHPQISGTTNYAIYSAGGQSYHSGKLGLGVTTPTAQLHLPAGTATASTAPLKFTSGANLTTPEAGAMEWDGTNLYITQATGPTRKTIAYTDDITAEVNDLTSAVTWANVPDVNITQSSVLQHQGALTIDNIPSRRIPIGTGTGIISATGFQLTTEGTLEWYSSTGADNTGAGGGALRFLNGTSTSNSAFGIQSMGTGIKNNTDLNSSFGAYSLAYITEGDFNTSLGAYSGLTLTTGSNNLFGGIYAGDNITTGSGNILLGTQAGANDATYNPDNMIAIGNRAAYNVDASNSESIFIGAESGSNEATYSDLILIGSQASATQSNQIVIGHEKTGFESTQLKSRNYRWNIDQTLGASQDGYVMTYNNTSGELELQAGDVSDGNGIFDAANDDGTIPATFEARLTDILYFSDSSGNEFMTLNGTTQQVGIGTIPSYDLDVDGTFGVSGTVRFEGYGVGLKEAADLSKTRSGYIATYATDGTLLEEEFTNPYGGESSLAGILDSLYAGQSGTEDHLMVPDASGNLAQRVGGVDDFYSVKVDQEETVSSWIEFNYAQGSQASLSVGSSDMPFNLNNEASGVKLYGSGIIEFGGKDNSGQAYSKTYMWPSRIYQQNYVEHGKIRIDSVSRNSIYVPGITRWVHNRLDPLNVPMPDSSVLVANYTVERRAGGNVNTYFDYIWKEAEADVRYRWGFDRTLGTTEHQKLYQNNPTFEIALHQNFVRIDGVKNTIDSSGVKTPINFLYTDETGKVLSGGIGALSGISFLAEDVSSSTISPATLKVITGETIGSDYAINARTSGDSLILKFFPAGLLPMSGSIADAAADQLMIIDVSESPDKAKRLTIQNMLGGSTAKTTPANAATVDFDANGLMGGKIQVNMTNVTTGITLSFSNMVDGGDYLIYFTNVTGTDTLTLPSGCINLQGDGSTVSSIDITENTYYYITYDGTNYYFR